MKSAPSLLVLAWVVALGGCDPRREGGAEGQPGGEAAFEEEIVGGPPDATLSTESDRVAPALGGSGLSGALPPGFPSDLPLYLPASVVDLGDGYVVFRANDPPEVVGVALAAEWRQAGWVEAGSGRYRRGPLEVGLALTPSRGGTSIRVEY